MVRRAPGPATVNEVEINEYLRERRSYGKYRPDSLRRLQATTMVPITIRIQAANAYASPSGGRLPLLNHFDSTNNIKKLPMHMYDVTSFCSTQAGSLVMNFADYGFTIEGTGTSSLCKVNQIALTGTLFSDRSGTGLNQAQWQIEACSGAGVANTIIAPPTKDLLKDVSAKLLCYGTTLKPVRYCVDWVQFPDDEYNPAYVRDLLNAGPAVQANSTSFTSMIEELTFPFIWNPITATAPALRQKYKILQHHEFVIQASSSVDAVPSTPHMHELDIFYKMDRVQKYDWQPSAALDAPSFITDPGAANQKYGLEQSVSNGTVAYKNRVYLMIRAQSVYTTTAGTIPTIGNTGFNPSYDIVLRAKHLTDAG